MQVVHEELTKLLGSEQSEIQLNRSGPAPLMLVGLQGVGKTTLAAKLALYFRKKKKKKVLLVPWDSQRPAAKKQLQVLGDQIGVPVYDSDFSKSIKDSLPEIRTFAIQNECEAMIFDTAGRLQIDEELMAEITELKSLLDPSEVLFVADAMTGQEAVQVAQTFHEKVDLTGVVLTKMDGDARGGAALSIKSMTGLPVKLVGMGEKVHELEPFYPDRVAGRILDMGDVLSLVEKAQEVITEEEALSAANKLKTNSFTMDDFQKQLKMMNKLGSLEGIMKMIPGMGSALSKIGDLTPAENEMKKIDALINSMTKAEKNNHKLLNGSRKKRIAAGSGTQVQDINRFINQFQTMQKMMSQFQKKGMGGLMGGKGFKMPF